MTTPKLEIIGLVKNYGELCVLDGIDVCVGDGEFISLVGASGCGKSTILGVVAGLVEPSAGQVLLDGHLVTGPGPDRGLVFQHYSLPWRSVRENVAFGLELRELPKREIDEQVGRFLEVMGLTRFADALPRALSGGMRQRTAIARALVNGPEVLLMDEPFGALDTQTRSAMQEFLLEMWRDPASCNTILLVTHDVEEAVFLSQRIYVLSSHPGRVMEEVTVPFGRDRTHSILRDPTFMDLVEGVRERLRVWAKPAG